MQPSDMTPEALLTAAAQASGLSYLQWVRESYPTTEGLLLQNRIVFNPLLVPVQATWLALDLRMSQRHENNCAVVDAPWAGIEAQVVPYGDKPMLALCRAIVQAAAAIALKGLTLKNYPA